MSAPRYEHGNPQLIEKLNRLKAEEEVRKYLGTQADLHIERHVFRGSDLPWLIGFALVVVGFIVFLVKQEAIFAWLGMR